MARNKSIISSHSGFTLLEVLVAGFILFLVLTTMTQVYQGAILASDKANSSIVISGSVNSLRSLISNAMLEKGDRNGEGEFGEVQYKWSANILLEGVSSPSLEESSPVLKYELYTVQLEINKGPLVKRYSFRELGWH